MPYVGIRTCKVVSVHGKKTCRGLEKQLNSFFNSTSDSGEGQSNEPVVQPPEKEALLPTG
jgi:hypothetical protein